MSQKLDIKVGFERWKQRWDIDKIPWHKLEVNPRLLQHSSHLFFDGEREYKVFVPLCGKAIDMKWFYDKGCTVVGADYCLKALEKFMEEQNVPYTAKTVGDVTVLESDDKRLRLWCCNLFDFPNLSGEKDFEIVWDRASFVAVNFSEREKYVEIMSSIVSPDFRYLLEWLNYDGSLFGGPPKTSTLEEIDLLFGKFFELKILSQAKSDLPPAPEDGLILASLLSPRVQLDNMAEEPDKHFGYEFWKRYWDTGITNWQMPHARPQLKEYSNQLFFDGDRQYKVLVPMCGKTVDMKWFYDKGCTVVGVEYCLKGLEEFMEEQEVSYSSRRVGDVTVLESDDKRLRLWCCNVFDFPRLSGENDFDIVWDIESFVVVNVSKRERYIKLIRSLLLYNFRYFIEWYHFDPCLYGGPPFPASPEEMETLFGEYYSARHLTTNVFNGSSEGIPEGALLKFWMVCPQF